MGIKIKLTKIDGEDRVPPAVMDILKRFAGHRDVCDRCAQAEKNGTRNFCRTGYDILRELAEQPEVSEHKD